jgi:uncharacterized protein YaaQ
MRLVIAVVQDQDVHRLLTKLNEKRYSVTKLASTGGFLRQGNTTLLVGVEPLKQLFACSHRSDCWRRHYFRA